LDEYALAVWERNVSALAKLDMLKATDTEALAVYCNEVSIYRQAALDIIDRGLTVVGPTLREAPNPSVLIAKGSAATIRAYANEFGFTPRAEVGLGKGDDNDNGDPFSNPFS
jgi:P27 family predicted phage terminase small subunit